MTARRFALLIPSAALVAAGGYVLVYLYRWEWHRALVAAAFMIALEVGVGFAMILDRLHRIEGRLDAAERTEAASTEAVLRDAAPEPAKPFEWLSDAPNRMSVFVPILLGAGVVLSALAWAVERVSRSVGGPVLERGLALRLTPLTVPAGALSGALSPAPNGFELPALRTRPAMSRRSAVVVVVALMAGGAFLVGLDRLEGATKNHADAKTAPAGRVVVRIANRGSSVGGVAAADALWGACATQIGARYRLTGVESLGDGRIELRVQPAIGKYAERRLRGCFEDATTDLVRSEVVEISAR